MCGPDQMMSSRKSIGNTIIVLDDWFADVVLPWFFLFVSPMSSVVLCYLNPFVFLVSIVCIAHEFSRTFQNPKDEYPHQDVFASACCNCGNTYVSITVDDIARSE